MTKYVVQSGGIKRMPEEAKAYFRELLLGLGSSPKLLWCFFADSEDVFDKQFDDFREIFKDAFPQEIELQNTCATLEDFEQQIADADAIYLHGGDTDTLEKHLQPFGDLEKLFAGKVVGTNSASTLVLSESGWNSDYRKHMKGYGILPIKTLVHYKSNYGANTPRGPVDWEGAREALKTFGDTSLPIHALKEGEFILIEK